MAGPPRSSRGRGGVGSGRAGGGRQPSVPPGPLGGEGSGRADGGRRSTGPPGPVRGEGGAATPRGDAREPQGAVPAISKVPGDRQPQ